MTRSALLKPQMWHNRVRCGWGSGLLDGVGVRNVAGEVDGPRPVIGPGVSLPSGAQLLRGSRC